MTHRNKIIVLVAFIVLVVAAGAVSLKMAMTSTQAARSSMNLGLSAGGSGVSVAPGAPSMDTSAVYSQEKAAYMPIPPQPTAGQTAAEVDQKIIKNGSLDLVVDSVASSADAITALAKSKGGFVQSSEVSERTDGTHAGFISIRVPEAEFESTMTAAKALATTVKSESATGQDVTEQYTDLQAQLRNAQAQEETYLQVLKQAKSVQDILNVQQYLGQIRGQIESLQGRIKYLENQTSLSTISIQLEEEPSVRAPTKAFQPVGAVKEAIQALVDLAQSLVIGLIWLVIVGGGIAIPVALLVWLLAKLIRRLSRRRP